MPQPAAPTKTPLGHDELRHRTQGLGQRFRTVLLLVDGQRSLAQILSMAHQAGAQTSHFERLVQLGMVELPREAAPEAAAGPTASAGPPPLVVPAPAPAGDSEVVELALSSAVASAEALPAETLPADASVAAASADDGPAVEAPAAEAPARFAAAAEPIPDEPLAANSHDGGTWQGESPPAGSAVAVPATASPAADAPVAAAPRPEPHPAAPPALPDPAPMAPLSLPQFDLAVGSAPAPESEPRANDEPVLAEVRRLLLDVLRRDALLTRAFAPVRVRAARTQADLIDLVWEIERERAHRRRRRGQLLNLQRARELLGMGNTLVDGDSLAAPSSEFDQ